MTSPLPSYTKLFTALYVLLSLSKDTKAFQTSHTHSSLSLQRWGMTHTTHLSLANKDEDENDDDRVNEDSLGDWRQFRANLARTGLPSSSSSTTATSSPRDMSLEESDAGSTAVPALRPTSVSKSNEKVLLSQSEDLAREYLDGVWAHDTAKAETGGLVVRMPLESEMRKMSKTSSIGRKLQKKLSLDDNDTDTSSSSESYDPSLSMTASSSSSSLSSSLMSFSPLAAQTAYWYRSAQSVLKSELKKVTDAAGENGQIDPNELNEESLELLQLYLDYQETWQEVCMVISRNEDQGTSQTLVINRPMAVKLTENLAKLVLFGSRRTSAADGFGAPLSVTDSDGTRQQVSEDLIRFLVAFEQECGLYVGGPDCQDEPAIMVHGIKDLEGSKEISPGCGIYEGGLEAAITGVLRGVYKPLDFRFFIGRHKYTNQELDKKVSLGKYQPVACARAVALKQCISLPKPLWHEVMELCGGELREISSLELMKRTDIVTDEDDNESD